MNKLNSKWLALTLLLVVCGCSPTPEERVKQLRGKISERGDRVIDVDLSGTRFNDSDIGYLHGLCSNSNMKWASIHSLDLSDTAITDKTLEFIAMQKGFVSTEGIKELIIRKTKVSQKAIEEFSKAVPNCKVRQ